VKSRGAFSSPSPSLAKHRLSRAGRQVRAVHRSNTGWSVHETAAVPSQRGLQRQRGDTVHDPFGNLKLNMNWKQRRIQNGRKVGKRSPARSDIRTLAWALACAVGRGDLTAAEVPSELTFLGGTTERLGDMVVRERSDSLIGLVDSATQGTVGVEQLKLRPIARAGEILETVPGVIITQHAGGGKANQYFLRGFNLDHGTDFATSIDSVPVNLPTHGHGQGYTDLNLLIPELVERVNYRKGVHYAENDSP
jgi:TonB-dependent Receptor Plug Domain